MKLHLHLKRLREKSILHISCVENGKRCFTKMKTKYKVHLLLLKNYSSKRNCKKQGDDSMFSLYIADVRTVQYLPNLHAYSGST